MHYHFEGTLTARDSKKHLPHTFQVPPDGAALEVDFRFDPPAGYDLSHLITLTIFDPAGFRGAGHRDGAHHRVRIAADGATPGYLPGPLPAGEWTVQLDTHRIMPGEPVRYSLDVDVTLSALPTSPLPGKGLSLIHISEPT
ncbi:MAG: phosphotransferase, partial [Anaerolineae bacterium]|nr:phosphotransferase [Anaerolineae bacterium]